MLQKTVYRLCIFCSARVGSNPRFKSSALALGRAMADAGIGLVFAGGGDGTMGVVAQSVKEHGGHVTGIVLPPTLEAGKVFGGIDERHVASDLQERKRLMFELSNGFVALPGGFSVLDALMEHLTWMQRGRQPKPVYLVNTAQYWDPLLQMFLDMQQQDFLPRTFEERYAVVDDSVDAVEEFVRYLSRKESRCGDI